jgi:hypothetical protein
VYVLKAVDKGMMLTLLRKELDDVKFQCASQNSRKFKTSKSFISKTFHVIFSDSG